MQLTQTVAARVMRDRLVYREFAGFPADSEWTVKYLDVKCPTCGRTALSDCAGAGVMNLRSRFFLPLRPEPRHRSAHAATQAFLHNLPGHGVGTHVQAAVTLHTTDGQIQVASGALSAAL